MENNWFIKRGGESSGPFTSLQLKTRAATGQLEPGDLIAKKGMTKWVEAAKVKGLFGASAVPPRLKEPPLLGIQQTLKTAEAPRADKISAVNSSAPHALHVGPPAKHKLNSKKLPFWVWIGLAASCFVAISFAGMMFVGVIFYMYASLFDKEVAIAEVAPSSTVQGDFESNATFVRDLGAASADYLGGESMAGTLGSIAETSSDAAPPGSADSGAVQSDDADAMLDMGHNYYQGIGVEQDFVQAAIYYQKAVDAGSTEALNDLAYMYVKGLGVTEDADTAAALYCKAGSSGSGMGMFNYGLCLAKGVGVNQNEFQSRLWIQRSSEAGYQPAQDYLAELQTQMKTQIFGAIIGSLFGGGEEDYSQGDNHDYYTEKRRAREYWEDRTRRAESAGDQMDADYARRQVP